MSYKKELEYAKCYLSDEGYEVDELNESCMRARKGTKYFYDIWVKYKKHRFLYFTIHNWQTNKYYRIQKIEQLLNN